VVVTRAKNGLIPGVDSSLANAEVSNAKISITQARDFEQEQANNLAQIDGYYRSAVSSSTRFHSPECRAHFPIRPFKTEVTHY
jgi:hypothetical protein